MGYLKIPNLSRDPTLLMFKELYALEKVHGTSTHITFGEGVSFFSGGCDALAFAELFDRDALFATFQQLGYPPLTIYGEGYGGKMQGMRKTYGDTLRFIAFDVKIGDRWLGVEEAESLVLSLGLEFVPWSRIPATEDAINAARDYPSQVAVRRGLCGIAEGIVLRPIIELQDRDKRLIAKHKRPEFSERASKKDTALDAGAAETLAKAKDIATEWVTPMRLSHVLGKIPPPHDEKITRQVIEAMVADIHAEAGEEIVQSKAATRAIGQATASLYLRSLP